MIFSQHMYSTLYQQKKCSKGGYYNTKFQIIIYKIEGQILFTLRPSFINDSIYTLQLDQQNNFDKIIILLYTVRGPSNYLVNWRNFMGMTGPKPFRLTVQKLGLLSSKKFFQQKLKRILEFENEFLTLSYLSNCKLYGTLKGVLKFKVQKIQILHWPTLFRKNTKIFDPCGILYTYLHFPLFLSN